MNTVYFRPHTENLFADNYEKYDEERSAQKYIELCLEKIKYYFPADDYEIIVEENSTKKSEVNDEWGCEDWISTQLLYTLCENIYNDFEWAV